MPKLVIVTGLSGAGKTQAMRCLEDLGFFCVDNLPPTLIPKFAELCAQAASKINKIALAVDIRGGEFFNTLFEVLHQIDLQGTGYEILFLEASDETLVRRYKESRRRHPLSSHGEILEVIREERSRLQDLRGKANKIIDTSNMAVQQLKEQFMNRQEVRDWLAANLPREPLASYDTREGFEQHREWERKLFDARLSMVIWPEALGGRGPPQAARQGVDLLDHHRPVVDDPPRRRHPG